jgi:sulfur-oxidizing protein SoxY
LTPANGEASFGTRIKLGSTQDVVAIAEMSDGTFLSAKQNVEVTIGGCG